MTDYLLVDAQQQALMAVAWAQLPEGLRPVPVLLGDPEDPSQPHSDGLAVLPADLIDHRADRPEFWAALLAPHPETGAPSPYTEQDLEQWPRLPREALPWRVQVLD